MTNNKNPVKEVMTTKHPRWGEFIERLMGPEGCNFGEDEKGRVAWDCNADMDRPHATAILKRMGNFDIPATFEYFEAHGGFCDCEIAMNVDSR